MPDCTDMCVCVCVMVLGWEIHFVIYLDFFLITRMIIYFHKGRDAAHEWSTCLVLRDAPGFISSTEKLSHRLILPA